MGKNARGAASRNARRNVPPPVYCPVLATSQQKNASLATPSRSGAPPVYRPFAATSHSKRTGAPPVYRPAKPASQEKSTAPATPARSGAPPVYRSAARASHAPASQLKRAVAPMVSAKERIPNTTVPTTIRKAGFPASPCGRPLVQMSRRGARGGPNLRVQYATAIFLIVANIIAGNPPLEDVDDLLDAPEGVADQVVGFAREEILKQQQDKAKRAQKQQQRDAQKQMSRQFRSKNKY